MRLLVLYHAGFTHTATIFHYLDSFRRYSRHNVEFFNIDQTYDWRLDFSGYDALFVNYCTVAVSRLEEPPFFMRHLGDALRKFRGPKIAAIQDEYDFTDRATRWLRKTGFDVVLTNLPAEGVPQLYPPSRFPDTRFERVLTGYISEELIEDADRVRPLAEREIVLGYRGRELPFRVGDLGWHKSEIGRQFKPAAMARGIPCDIETNEDARFHGGGWFDFIRRCQVHLGTPSGSNVFDFDGSLHEYVRRAWERNQKITYLDVREKIQRHTVGFDMGQISPRVFEAVACRTALALMRGSYSGVLKPDEHYVAVSPDYSNINEVLDRILDTPAMQAMADRAYDHVIGNSGNHYRGFVGRIDDLFDEAAGAPPTNCRSSISADSASADLLPQFSVSRAPLGCDPYLVGKLTELREQLRAQVLDIAKAAAEHRLEVVPYRGTYRVLRHAHPR